MSRVRPTRIYVPYYPYFGAWDHNDRRLQEARNNTANLGGLGTAVVA